MRVGAAHMERLSVEEKVKTPHRKISTPDETLGEHWKRRRNSGARKPLRSLKEMAAEFGVSVPTLFMTMRHDQTSPKPIYSTGGSSTTKNTWVDPDLLRAWWKNREKKS